MRQRVHEMDVVVVGNGYSLASAFDPIKSRQPAPNQAGLASLRLNNGDSIA